MLDADRRNRYRIKAKNLIDLARAYRALAYLVIDPELAERFHTKAADKLFAASIWEHLACNQPCSNPAIRRTG